MKKNFLTELYRLRTVQLQMGYQRAWVYHQLKVSFDLGLPELRTIAKTLGYKSGWAAHKWRELQPDEKVSAPQSSQLSYLQNALSLFGLRVPFTTQELKRAYRTKALEAHPDAGGSNELFVSVNQAYESLKELARTIGGSRPC